MEGMVKINFNTNKIKALMVLNGDNQSDLANYLNISRISVSRKLNGQVSFNNNEINAILKKYGKDINYFLKEEE